MHGVNRLVNELESKFGKRRLDSITKSAIEKAVLVVSMELYRQLATFKDKGYTIDELTISDTKSDAEGPRVTIYWRGRHDRYRIIHLNEWGTIRNPRPRGKGKIAKALKIAQKPYGKVVRDEIRRYL